MNYFYRLRYSLYTFFGLIPDVAKIEEKREKIRNEFNRLNKIGSSEKLQKYIDLDQFINSKDYKDRKKAIEAQKYRGSEAYHKEKRYKKLARSSKIKTYYKVKDSADLKFLKEFKDSDKLNKFLELKKYFKSEKFPADKEQIKKERQKKINDLKSKKKEYQTLKRKFRWYEKLKNNRKFNDFLHFKDSDTFIQYLELEEEVKNYSLKEVKTRYKTRQKELKSEKKRLEKRYKQLEKQARKANKKKKPFPNEQELERLKETMAEGKYDKMIRDADYKQAIEYVKIQQFKELRKNKRIRTAAAFYHSENYRRYLEVQGSDELNRYEELKNYINQQYKKDLQNAKAHTYKNSEIYRQYQEYKQLKADKDIKRYLKFENSRKYKIFTELNNSELIEEYENLHQYVHTKEFSDYKKYMKDPKKFKLSDEYKQLQEYKNLKKDKDIKWYYRNKESRRFREHRMWELTFEESFEAAELDDNKWDTLPYPAKRFISGTYSQWNDEQLYKEAGNHKIDGGILKLETKKEEQEGKAWHPTMGFLPKKFGYTSAMLNTGENFRQQYGKFEAKIRMGYAYSLIQSFHLSSDYRAPEIVVADYGETKSSKAFKAGAYVPAKDGQNSKGRKSKLKGRNLGGHYHLFTLLWDKNEIEWKINGLTIMKEKNNIPEKELFLNFFPSVQGEIDDKRFPVSLDIDWVSVYQKRKE